MIPKKNINHQGFGRAWIAEDMTADLPDDWKARRSHLKKLCLSCKSNR
jgi:hypothetical protein